MPETMEELKEKAWADYAGIEFWENGYGYAMFNYAWDACFKACYQSVFGMTALFGPDDDNVKRLIMVPEE